MKIMNGFTLIEVLISVIILAIGLLGIAAMQMSGIKTNDSAYLRSQASVMAYEIIDRMRANRDRNTEKLDKLKGYQTDFNDEMENTPDCASNPCSEDELINSDIGEWKNSLRTLPSGVGSISIALEDGMVIAEVSVRWNDTRDSKDLITFTTQTRL